MVRWKRLQREGARWKNPSKTGHTKVGRGKSKGNKGEDTELIGTVPACHTSHRVSF